MEPAPDQLTQDQRRTLDHYIRFAAKPSWRDNTRWEVRQLVRADPAYWGWLPQAIADGLRDRAGELRDKATSTPTAAPAC